MSMTSKGDYFNSGLEYLEAKAFASTLSPKQVDSVTLGDHPVTSLTDGKVYPLTKLAMVKPELVIMTNSMQLPLDSPKLDDLRIKIRWLNLWDIPWIYLSTDVNMMYFEYPEDIMPKANRKPLIIHQFTNVKDYGEYRPLQKNVLQFPKPKAENKIGCRYAGFYHVDKESLFTEYLTSDLVSICGNDKLGEFIGREIDSPRPVLEAQQYMAQGRSTIQLYFNGSSAKYGNVSWRIYEAILCGVISFIPAEYQEAIDCHSDLEYVKLVLVSSKAEFESKIKWIDSLPEDEFNQMLDRQRKSLI